jgi:hypothetical protein
MLLNYSGPDASFPEWDSFGQSYCTNMIISNLQVADQNPHEILVPSKTPMFTRVNGNISITGHKNLQNLEPFK